MTTPTKPQISRRTLLAASVAVPLCGILTRPAFAAEFNYKLATGQDPTHPVNTRAQEAIERMWRLAAQRMRPWGRERERERGTHTHTAMCVCGSVSKRERERERERER